MASERSFCKIRASYDELFIVIYRNRTWCKPYQIIFVIQWLLLDSVVTFSELSYFVIQCKNISGDVCSSEFIHNQRLPSIIQEPSVYHDGTFEDTYGRAKLVM